MIIIILVAIIFLLIEGGYRFHQAELAKYADKHIFNIAQHGEGILTYARNRKAERPTGTNLMFCRKSLQPVLGDNPEKFEDVMAYLVKSGHAMKALGHPECWYID